MKKFLSLVLLFGILFGIFPKNSFALDKFYDIERKICENKDLFGGIYIVNDNYYVDFSEENNYYLTINGEKILSRSYIDIHNRGNLDLDGNLYDLLEGGEIFKNGEKIRDKVSSEEYFKIYDEFFLKERDNKYFSDKYNLEITEKGIFKNGNLLFSAAGEVTIKDIIGDDIFYSVVKYDSDKNYIGTDLFKNNEKIKDINLLILRDGTLIYGTKKASPDSYDADLYQKTKLYRDNIKFINKYNLEVRKDSIYKNGKLLFETDGYPEIVNVIGEDIYYNTYPYDDSYGYNNIVGSYKNNEKILYDGNGKKLLLTEVYKDRNGDDIYIFNRNLFFKNGKFLGHTIYDEFKFQGNDFYTYYYDMENSDVFVKKNDFFYKNMDTDEVDLESNLIYKFKFEDFKEGPYESIHVNSKGDVFFWGYYDWTQSPEGKIFKNGKLFRNNFKCYLEKQEENSQEKIYGSAPNLEDLVLKNDDRVKVLDYLKNDSGEKVEEKNILENENKNKILENKENLELNSATEKTEMKVEEEKKSEKIENKKEEIKYLEEFYFDKEIPEKIEEERIEISEIVKKEEIKMNNLKITRLPKTGPLEIFLIIFSLIATFGIFKFRKRKV